MATNPAHAAPLQAFSALLSKPETRYITNLPLPTVAAFVAAFVADAAPYPLHRCYVEQGATGLTCAPWAQVTPICSTREVVMTRKLQGYPQKVVQNVVWWALNDSNTLLRVRHSTPEWFKAKEVFSIEYLLVSAAVAPVAAVRPPLNAGVGSASPILLTCCYDLEIKRSGLGMFVPADFAKCVRFPKGRSWRWLWPHACTALCILCLAIVASLPAQKDCL